MSIANKNILLGVTGGIAAYKSAEIARRLRDHKAEVRVVMTANAEQFITPLTMQAVSGNPVHQSLLDPAAEAGMGHIELARWADLVLVAPATANFIARLARGAADDLLTTLCLATEAPIALAPAMNQQMWLDPATQNNAEVLGRRNVQMLGPGVGDQACGETGPGRMLEPALLVERASSFFAPASLEGCTVVVSAGPTWEAIDPVRGLTNRSSGKMGYAVAEAAVEAGADVLLVSGPTALPPPDRLRMIQVSSAREMFDVIMQEVENADIFISVAAVADYSPREPSQEKIKKDSDTLTIELVKNADILSEVAKSQRLFTVGFAAETSNVEQHARQKLLTKGVDMIAANHVGADKAFGKDENSLLLVDRSGTQPIPHARKTQLARTLIETIAKKFYAKNSS